MSSSLIKNEYGVIQYPKGDVRRLLVLAAAVDALERPTITSLAKYTGHNKGTISKDINKLNEQLGVIITKTDSVYEIQSWGDLLKKGRIRRYFSKLSIDE